MKNKWDDEGQAGFEDQDGVSAWDEIETEKSRKVKKTKDAIKDAERELTGIEKAFRERRAKEKDRFKIATQSEFWFCVCFKSQEQKDAFLKAVGLFEQGDKYIDGCEWAKSQDIELPHVELQKKRR